MKQNLFFLPLCKLKAAVSEKEDISYDLFLSILKNKIKLMFLIIIIINLLWAYSNEWNDVGVK